MADIPPRLVMASRTRSEVCICIPLVVVYIKIILIYLSHHSININYAVLSLRWGRNINKTERPITATVSGYIKTHSTAEKTARREANGIVTRRSNVLGRP